MKHEFDDEGICEICGFDGAEWHHWKTSTYEGKALAGVGAGDNRMMIPNCVDLKKPYVVVDFLEKRHSFMVNT